MLTLGPGGDAGTTASKASKLCKDFEKESRVESSGTTSKARLGKEKKEALWGPNWWMPWWMPCGCYYYYY